MGTLKATWYTENKKTYYKNPDGTLAKGWQTIDGYNEILSKHKTDIFLKKKLPVYNMLLTDREKFEKLVLDEQMQILCQILMLTRMGTNLANLSLLGEGSSIGTMNISCNISNYKSAVLVERSITGLYKKRIDLLEV